MLSSEWVSNDCIQLYSDSAGNASLGCGVYFQGKWAFLKWPIEWADSEILHDITFLELVPIFLAIFLWKHEFIGLRIRFNCDNQSVVHILNSKTSRSKRVMTLIRKIVLFSLRYDFHINGLFIAGTSNKIADSISRMQWATFRQNAPEADLSPTRIPQEFWQFLPAK